MTPEQKQWFDKWDAENCAADNAQFTVGHVARDYARKAVEAALADLPASQELIHAAESADWGQVVANGGPPCFHIEDRRFCLRAERWIGHGKSKQYFSYAHDFVPLKSIVCQPDLPAIQQECIEEVAFICQEMAKIAGQETPQGGYRSVFQAATHLVALTQVVERSNIPARPAAEREKCEKVIEGLLAIDPGASIAANDVRHGFEIALGAIRALPLTDALANHDREVKVKETELALDMASHCDNISRFEEVLRKHIAALKEPK